MAKRMHGSGCGRMRIPPAIFVPVNALVAAACLWLAIGGARGPVGAAAGTEGRSSGTRVRSARDAAGWFRAVTPPSSQAVATCAWTGDWADARMPADRFLAADRSLAKHEPLAGCYIGAFIDNCTEGSNISAFEQRVGHKHAIYINYIAWGRPFPVRWASELREHGAAAQIAFEPNGGLHEVRDGPYLRRWAMEANRAGIPIFLRFASEMNGAWTAYSGDPELYKEKFRLVHDVMERYAPNVAMVWVPFAIPQKNIADFYPGDEWVDWAGLNIYSVYCHDGNRWRPAYDEDPTEFLAYVYNRYADRKPIFIGEFAASHHCAVYGDRTAFAVEKMARLYGSLRTRFPRVKAICWFSFDAVERSDVHNRYALYTNRRVRETYSELTADPHFLTRVSPPPRPILASPAATEASPAVMGG